MDEIFAKVRKYNQKFTVISSQCAVNCEQFTVYIYLKQNLTGHNINFELHINPNNI